MKDETNGPNKTGTPSLSPVAAKRLLVVLIIASVLVVLLDLTYHKHGHYGFEQLIGFHAFVGFVSCVVLALFATLLRKFVKREEDYYDD